MFELLARLRPGITTHYDLVRQERAVVGPHIAGMPIVREHVLGASDERTAIEGLRACILSVTQRGDARYRDGSWIARLTSDRVVTFEVRARRHLEFGKHT